MKKNGKELIILIMFTLILIATLTHSTLIVQSIKDCTQVWLFKLFPSLFPFLVLGNILINYNFGYYLCRIFKFKSNEIVVFFLSLISGFPSSAKYTREMYLKKLLKKENADNVLCYSFFANPLFLMTVLKPSFSLKIIILIILSHYLANVFIAFGFKKSHEKIIKLETNQNLGTIISLSIKEGINTLLLILGTITFYNIIITLLKDIIKNKSFMFFLSGLLEFSQGLNNLNGLDVSLYLKALMALIFISFGSLSILTQIKSIISDTNLNFAKFVKFRLVHV